MKILNKLKVLVLTIVALPVKVFGFTAASFKPPVDVTPMLYGVPRPSTSEMIMMWLLTIIKIIAIPLVLLIGLSIYIKKTNPSKKKKIILKVILGIIIVAIFLYIFTR